MIWYRGDLETWVCGPGVQFSVVGLALGWDMVLGCMSQSGAGVYRKSRYAVFNLILGLTDSLGLWVLLGSLDRWSLLRAWDYGVTSGYGNHSQCWDEKASWVDRSLLGAWCHESCLGLLEPADIEVRGYVFLGADKEPPRFIGIGLVLGRPALLPQWVCLSPHWAFYSSLCIVCTRGEPLWIIDFRFAYICLAYKWAQLMGDKGRKGESTEYCPCILSALALYPHGATPHPSSITTSTGRPLVHRPSSGWALVL